MMKIQLQKFRPVWILVTVFIIIVMLEAYLMYFRVYHNLSSSVGEIPNENVVRLDLNAYNKTLSQLDANKIYTPPPWSLTHPEPFR